MFAFIHSVERTKEKGMKTTLCRLQICFFIQFYVNRLPTKAAGALACELSEDHHGNFSREVGWKDCGSCNDSQGTFLMWKNAATH